MGRFANRPNNTAQKPRQHWLRRERGKAGLTRSKNRIILE